MNHITQEQAIEKEKNRKVREALDAMKVAQQTPPKRRRTDEHITKEKALDIAENVGPSSTNAEYYHAICNAAIEHYIAQQAAPEEPYDKTEMNAFVTKLYQEKSTTGQHGFYETLYHVVHQAIKRATTKEQT